MKAPRFTLDQLNHAQQAEVANQLYKKGDRVVMPDGKYAICIADSVEIPPKPKKGRKVARTRNAGTITEAAYWGMLRSGLRRLFRFWKPAVKALHAARVPYSGKHGQKWAYLCADCNKLFKRDGVQIDHVEPVGALTCLDHVPGFVARLTPEDSSAFKIRCTRCHQTKTNQERK